MPQGQTNKPEEPDFTTRRYAWLSGLFISAAGAGIALVGGATFFALRDIQRDTLELYEAGITGEKAGNLDPAKLRVFCAVALVILVLGVAVTLSGVALTVSLRRRRKKLEGKQ